MVARKTSAGERKAKEEEGVSIYVPGRFSMLLSCRKMVGEAAALQVRKVELRNVRMS